MRLRLLTVLLTAWAVAPAPVAAYYHYNHYTALGIIQQKFDLNALPNRTLTFYVSDAGPVQYASNDSFPTLLAQIRQAAQVWNAVETSDLRVAFGGLISQGTPQATPGAMVIFEDVPPGWVAYTSHTVADPVNGPAGAFVPIVQGVVHLNRNMARQAPSYMESFYTTLVHEMGHALGLQHTFTSSAMSTGITRATSRNTPLEADDIAGISLLYPSRAFTTSFGSISGRVTSGGQPVHLASVVALRPAAPAISTLTNPDGTYRIDGLPQDTYWVYVHALPQDPDMQWPMSAGQPMLPTGPIETLFYPGTRDPQFFAPIAVTRGNTSTGIDFSVQRRAAPAIAEVTTSSYMGQNYVSPAYLNTLQQVGTLVAQGAGLTMGTSVTPGLGVQALGGYANLMGVQAFGTTGTWLAIHLHFSAPVTGPRHLLFTLPNDAYVLPSAVHLAQKAPPSVLSVAPNPDGTVTVAGANMGADSRVYFDGLQATVRGPFSGTDQLGAVTVAPPPGAAGQTASVIVYNADEQNSTFLQPQPPLYSYPPSDAPFAAVTPSSLPAGATAMVEVNGVNMNFTDGQTALGFGSSDVLVRRVWVTSPTRLIANVMVSPNAGSMPTMITVMSGFRLFSQPFGFQPQPANPRAPSITLPIANANPNQTGIYPGAVVTLSGANLAISPASAAITIADQPAQIVSAAANQITFVIPGVPVGPAILRLNNGAEAALPVVVAIEAAPPVVASVMSSQSFPVDGSRPAQAGDVLNVMMLGVDPSVAGTPSRVRVIVGATELQALAVLPVPGRPEALLAQVILAPTAPGMQIPVTVRVDGGTPSSPFYIAVR